jgi:NAD(P)H-dependent flavin oxidoreductase YrpB (nitropropane dioxygenase family)
MGWVAGARLAAATSSTGALGIIASATMTYGQLARAIDEVKERTWRPFGVNLRADHAQVDMFVDLLIRERVKVASFAQAPNERLVKRLRDGGVLTMPTVAARRHAEKVAAFGVDALIAQGHEGGGHTGAVPTTLLLADVAGAAWGAAGIAMGTRFLLTKESTVPVHVKARYLSAAVTDTVVTRSIDGFPQRVIRTDLVDHLDHGPGPVTLVRALANALRLRKLTGTSVLDLLREGRSMRKSGDLSLAQLAMAANAPMLTRATMVDGHLETGILPTGQVVGVIDELPTVAELVERIVAEAVTTLERLGA